MVLYRSDMLDLKIIRENPGVVKESVISRQMGDGSIVDEIVALDARVSLLLKEIENKRSLRNKISESISTATDTQRAALLKDAATIKDDLKKLEIEYTKQDESLKTLLSKLPNLISRETPLGKDDSENKELKKFGQIKTYSYTPKDHIELGESLDLIDIESAGKITGSRFYYLKNEAVLLQFALISFCLESVTNEKLISELAAKVGSPYSKPFSPIIPPVFIRPEVMKKMDRLDPIEERYYIPSDDLVLVGSAEHTLGPLFMDQTVDKNTLPIRYIGYSTAFRRESGSYGKDVKGILRVHQFDKLEMETFVPVEYGSSEQQLLVAIQEYLLQKLEIPYHVVDVCTGDMGKPDYRQIDIECWVPSQGKYRETHSADYMTDFQSRRLQSAYRDTDGTRKYLYMNDATALAIGRMLIVILENYQNEDGTVTVPQILRKYVGKDLIGLKPITK